MIIFSIKGKGTGFILWDETSLRMHQHGRVIIPALIEHFGQVIVVAADAAQKELEKLQNAGKLAGWEIMNGFIFGPQEPDCVLHTADPSWLTIQSDIEIKASKNGVPIFRLEDIPGAVFRSDITDPAFKLPPLKNPQDRYLLVNEASRRIALAKGVKPEQVEIVGLPDFEFPDFPATLEYQALRPVWKRNLGFAESFVVVYSGTSEIVVDMEALDAVAEGVKKAGGVLIASPHPKIFKEYPEPLTAQARLMMERGRLYRSWLQDHLFFELTGQWDGQSRLLFWTKGSGALFEAGCPGEPRNFPPDLLPADLAVSPFANAEFVKALWGTPAFNLSTEASKQVHLKFMGTELPMAVASGVFSSLNTAEDIAAAVADASQHPEKFLLTAEQGRQAAPFAGAECVDRIIRILKGQPLS